MHKKSTEKTKKLNSKLEKPFYHENLDIAFGVKLHFNAEYRQNVVSPEKYLALRNFRQRNSGDVLL